MVGLGASVAIAMAVHAAAPIEIEWNAPPECPAPAELRASIVELLGGEETREPVHASATVVREGQGYAAELVLAIGDSASTRRLVADECAALAEAAAVVVAVAVEPARTEVLDVPEPSAPELPPASVPAVDATTERAVVVIAPSERPNVEPPRVRRVPGVHLRIFGGPDYGATPKLTGTIGAAVGLRDRGWRAELAGGWSFAREARLDDMREVTASFGRWAIAARGCGVPARGRIEVPLCGAIEGGAIVGKGTGATVDQRTRMRPWIAAAIGPALAVAIVPRVAIVIGAELVVPLWRARFEIGDRLVHQPQRVGVRGALGVEVRLGRRP